MEVRTQHICQTSYKSCIKEILLCIRGFTRLRLSEFAQIYEFFSVLDNRLLADNLSQLLKVSIWLRKGWEEVFVYLKVSFFTQIWPRQMRFDSDEKWALAVLVTPWYPIHSPWSCSAHWTRCSASILIFLSSGFSFPGTAFLMRAKSSWRRASFGLCTFKVLRTSSWSVAANKTISSAFVS